VRKEGGRGETETQADGCGEDGAARAEKEVHDDLHRRQAKKRVPRPPQVDGMDVDEFIRRNADPIWLHQNGMWESMTCDDEDAGSF